MELADRVRAALREVIDPELGQDIVSLGLVYAVEAEDGGRVRIVMTTTTRGCPLAGFLTAAAEACAAGVEGVDSVTVTLTYEPPWTPARMTV